MDLSNEWETKGSTALQQDPLAKTVERAWQKCHIDYFLQSCQDFDVIVDFLNKEFLRRKKKNARYSIRAFAKALGVDASAFARILKGERKLSAPVARTVLDRLNLDESLKATLLLSLHEPSSTFPDDRDYVVPPASTAKWMAHWEFYAVLSILEIPKVAQDVDALAERLGSRRETISGILGCLAENGLIRKVNRRWVPSGVRLTTPPDFPAASAKASHRENIEKSIESLMSGDWQTRDISGITVAMPIEKFPEAVRRIKVFRRMLGRYLGEGEPDSVYRLNIQFFPLAVPKR